MTKLKFTPRTIDIIKNFSTINPSLLFRQGSVIRTRNPGNNLYGTAKVSEEFEQEFAIYDLSRFISILSEFTDPELKFGDKSAVIAEAGRRLSYRFCEVEDIVVAPNTDMNIPKPFIKVTLPKEELARVLKAQAILSLPEIVVVGKDKKISLETTSTETKVVDNYSTQIGDTDLTFKVVVKAELLTKLLGDENYSLEISKNKNEGIIAFRGKDVDYYVAPEPNSEYPSA